MEKIHKYKYIYIYIISLLYIYIYIYICPHISINNYNQKINNKCMLYPMCKKVWIIECTVQVQSEILILHSIAIECLPRVSRNSSPQHDVEGLLFSWPWPCLSSLLDLLFLDPLGKTAAVLVVLFGYWPLSSPVFFAFKIHTNHRNSSNMCFLLTFAPWQETFADAADEDGGGESFGIIWDHFRSILCPL